jgi:hypothetical protein
MKAMEITEDELSKAIEDYLATSTDEPGKEPGTIATGEVMSEYKIGRVLARKILRAMMEDGKLEPAYIGRRDLWGSNQRYRGFRWVNGDKE